MGTFESRPDGSLGSPDKRSKGFHPLPDGGWRGRRSKRSSVAAVLHKANPASSSYLDDDEDEEIGSDGTSGSASGSGSNPAVAQDGTGARKADPKPPRARRSLGIRERREVALTRAYGPRGRFLVDRLYR